MIPLLRVTLAWVFPVPCRWTTPEALDKKYAVGMGICGPRQMLNHFTPKNPARHNTVV